MRYQEKMEKRWEASQRIVFNIEDKGEGPKQDPADAL